MINEPQIIDLMTRKIIQPIQNKCNTFQETLIPHAYVYEVIGRRGFHKDETRMLGHFFESKGLLKISKRGWLIKPDDKIQNKF